MIARNLGELPKLRKKDRTISALVNLYLMVIDFLSEMSRIENTT